MLYKEKKKEGIYLFQTVADCEENIYIFQIGLYASQLFTLHVQIIVLLFAPHSILPLALCKMVKIMLVMIVILNNNNNKQNKKTFNFNVEEANFKLINLSDGIIIEIIINFYDSYS